MEKISVVCPDCKANVYLDEKRDTVFCSCCGVKITIDSSNEDDEKENKQTDTVEEKKDDEWISADILKEESVAEETDNVESNQEKNHVINTKIYIISIVAIIAFIAIFLTCYIVNKESKYEKAVALVNAEEYDAALAAFAEIGSYKDSVKQINEINAKIEEERIDAIISEAQEIYDSGDKLGAYKLLVPEKSNEKISEIIVDYKKEIVDEANTKIEWIEDSMSDYRWAFPKNDDTIGFLPNLLSDPYFTIYLAESKTDPSQKVICLRVITEEYTVGFTPPVHPVTIRLRNDAGEIDIPVGLYDRDFEAGVYSGYDWKEKVTVEITLEQANEIYEMFKSDDPVKMRLIGSQRNRDFVLETDEAQAIMEIVEYLNVIYLID